MKRTIIIGMISVLLAACSTTDEEPVPAPDGKVRVEFQLPGSYGVNVSHAQSKAVDNLDPNWHELPNADATLLPVGSTLWLSYAKQNEDGTSYSEPDLQGYVVGTNASGYNTLYPCTTTEGADGKLSATGTADYDGKMFSFNDLSDLEKVYAREAAHRILYTVTNSAAMNGRIHGLAPEGFAHYKIILICLDVVAAAGVGVLAFCIVKKLRKKQPKAA